ncbi:MAG: integrase arm-type DNA-binding domain-containing protein [Gammaproteobacteria bacterium]|nr:integrase arm-type DNA-binding domain-containing protein [Gammaproteobacteria bacterium]
MPRIVEPLSPLVVSRLDKPGLYAVGGVAGLQLQVTTTGSRSWVLRVRVGSKRRDIGLGGYPTVSLAQARDKARAVRQQIEQGVDPVLERQAAKARLVAAQAAQLSFDEAVKQFLQSKRQEIVPKAAQHWKNTLATYASPVVGQMHVGDIGLGHVLAVLEPIWTTKTETAKRLRGRIEAVLAWAIVRGYRQGDNPARWKGNLDAVLPKPTKVAPVKHMRALPYPEMPDFMCRLALIDGQGARALQFAILTAARSGEVRGATWQEFDLTAKTWTIPAERMKAGKIHHVPLCDTAINLLKALPTGTPGDYVFPAKRGGMLSDMTLSAVTRRMGVDAVPHGFRSTFRDWAAEQTDYPREVAEMALAHSVQGVEGAYRRGDLYDKRVQLMADWSGYLAPRAGGDA